MSGSSSFPYNKLSGYEKKAFPGRLPVKKQPISVREMANGSHIRGLSGPYQRQSPQATHDEQINFYRQMAQLRRENSELFDNYVIDNISYQDVNRWFVLKQIEMENANPGSRITPTMDRRYWEDSLHSIEKLLNEGTVGQFEAIYKILPILQEVSFSDGCKLFVVNGLGNSLRYFRPGLLPMALRDRKMVSGQGERGNTRVSLKTNVAAHVAFKVEPVIVDDLSMDERFPDGALSDEEGIISMMCCPIMLANGEVLGVIEFYRFKPNFPYSMTNVDQVMRMVEWIANTIHRAKTSRGMEQLSEMSSFLLNTTENYLHRSTSSDDLVRVIMRFAKSTVGADRCSFFLHDEENGDLFCTLFDTGGSDGMEIKKDSAIRVPIGKGIAGTVAKTKTILNIKDPYSDPRFNKEVDKKTGYITRNIICAPVLCDGKLYGVVQLLNKIGSSYFSATDQKTFEMFTVYCSLAIRFMNMNFKLTNEGLKLSIIEEILETRTALPDEKLKLSMATIPRKWKKKIPNNFSEWGFPIFEAPTQQLFLYFVYMCRHVCDTSLLPDDDVIMSFVMEVEAGYRKLEYHNFVHAMVFTHTCYLFITKHAHFFAGTDAVILLCSSVTHDIDHRGFSSDFWVKTEHPLGRLYGETSANEHHHYAMARQVLAKPQYDMFKKFKPDEKLAAFAKMEDCIIATDLSLFFPLNQQLTKMLDNHEYDELSADHKKLAIRMMMTACDLALMANPDFDAVQHYVGLLFHEYWSEGDLLKKNKLACIDMLNRDLQDKLVDVQIGFFSFVLVKCYETTSRVFPESNALEKGVKMNLDRWKDLKRAKEEAVREEELRKRRKEEEERLMMVEEEERRALNDSGEAPVDDDEEEEED